MLAYGRASETAPRISRVVLRPLVEDAAEILGLSTGTDVGFVNNIPRDLEVDADPEQLFRVIYNLCRNAVQALESDTVETKCITVSSERSDHGVAVMIDDNGPGMPQKARDNLFSAFRGSARAGGTGLGLAIAREIIEAHRGWIVLEDKAERGTRFRFELPDRANT